MILEPNPVGDVVPAVSPSPSDQRRENWPRLARRAWIVLALLLLVYFVASLPVYYQTSLTVCTPSDTVDCSSALVTEGNVQALAQLHLSVATYLSFLVALHVAPSLLGWAIGVLIFWRGSREWSGLFFSMLVVVASATTAASTIAGTAVSTQTPLLLQLLVAVSGVLVAVNNAAFTALLLTFPTGRFAPRWSWVLIVLQIVLPAIPPPASPSPAFFIVTTIVWFLAYIGIVGVQVYRYARVYNSIQRQQTKWFVFALGVLIVVVVIVSLQILGAPDSWYQLLVNPIYALAVMLLALSVGIAVLRYRLWDIDVLINRALVYGSLTALLVALYVGLILALQALVRTLTGSLTQEPLVLVASTLAIAAVFQPLRRRIQSTIDGRFYRRKYDAAKVVAAFSSTLRQEVDLDELQEQLVAVVQETMQPSHVALWLRPASPAMKPRTL